MIVPLENTGLGGYGFSVHLDSGLAIKARKEIMKEDAFKQFKKEGIEIIRSFLITNIMICLIGLQKIAG